MSRLLTIAEIAAEIKRLTRGEKSELKKLGINLDTDSAQIENTVDEMTQMNKKELLKEVIKAGVEKKKRVEYMLILKSMLDMFAKNKSFLLSKLLQVVPVFGYVVALQHLHSGKTERAKASFLVTTKSTVALGIIFICQYLIIPVTSTALAWATKVGSSTLGNGVGGYLEYVGANNWIIDSEIRQELDAKWSDVFWYAVTGALTGASFMMMEKDIKTFCESFLEIFGSKFRESLAGRVLAEIPQFVPSGMTKELEACVVNGLVLSAANVGMVCYKTYIRYIDEDQRATKNLEDSTKKTAAFLATSELNSKDLTEDGRAAMIVNCDKVLDEHIKVREDADAKQNQLKEFRNQMASLVGTPPLL